MSTQASGVYGLMDCRYPMVAVLIDGFSRKTVGLSVFGRGLTTAGLVFLINEAVTNGAAPRFIVTDRGGEFQKVFRAAMVERGTCHARGQPQAWQFNAKVVRSCGAWRDGGECRWFCPT